VVFALGADPVAMGLVASFNRPGGNITGSTSIAHSLAPKRLELLRAFVRGDAAMAIMVNPDTGEIERKESEAAALAMGGRLEVLTARNESEIIAAFASVRQRRIGGLIIAPTRSIWDRCAGWRRWQRGTRCRRLARCGSLPAAAGC
jgi:putative tryptophan/tyrosine transport system substrate-binding protein